MKKVLDWFRNLSLKWKLTFLLFGISSIFFIFEYLLLESSSYYKIFIGGLWVIFEVVISLFGNVSEELFFLIWLSIFFLYCLCFGYFFEILFKKFNFKVTFKNVCLVLIFFIILDFILSKIIFNIYS